MGFVHDQRTAGLQHTGNLAHEQRHIRHPAQHADGHQGNIEPCLQTLGQMVDIGLNELRAVWRGLGQLPRLFKKRPGLINPHHRTGAQAIQRKAFAPVVAAQLHHVLAHHAYLLQQGGDGRVKAGKIRLGYRVQQCRPGRGVFMQPGGFVPGISIAGDRLLR